MGTRKVISNIIANSGCLYFIAIAPNILCSYEAATGRSSYSNRRGKSTAFGSLDLAETVSVIEGVKKVLLLSCYLL